MKSKENSLDMYTRPSNDTVTINSISEVFQVIGREGVEYIAPVEEKSSISS